MALEVIESLPSKDGIWLFPSPHRPDQSIGPLGKAAVRIRDRSGVVDYTPHDFRRTAATIMTGLGISRLVVSKLLNHTEPGITRVYDRHSYDREKRDAMDAWAIRLREIIGQTGEFET